jgi:hypothetical protein
MMSDETLIEDLIDGYNGDLDSWEEPLVFRRAEKEINLLRERLAELEAADKRGSEYLAESVENEVEALERIAELEAAMCNDPVYAELHRENKRLDAALAEIENIKLLPGDETFATVDMQNIARKARAGE